jgi:hypothetical protein
MDFVSVIDLEALLPLIRDLAILVFVVVQGGKIFGVIPNGRSGQVALVSSALFGVLVAVKILYEPAAQYVDLFFALLVGVGLAGGFYRYFAKPILEKLGVPVSNEDLNGG